MWVRSPQGIGLYCGGVFTKELYNWHKLKLSLLPSGSALPPLPNYKQSLNRSPPRMANMAYHEVDSMVRGKIGDVRKGAPSRQTVATAVRLLLRPLCWLLRRAHPGTCPPLTCRPAS